MKSAISLAVLFAFSLIAYGATPLIGPETAFTRSLKTNTAAGGWRENLGLDQPINVWWYGADPTGVTDSTAAIQAAIDASTNTPIIVPDGRYKLLKGLTNNPASANFVLIAEGNGATLDWSEATFTTEQAALNVSGSTVALPRLSGALPINSISVSFATAHGLAVGDVFILCDTNTGSYNPERAYYYQGDYLRVASITSDTEVQTTTRTLGNYPDAGTVLCAKLLPVRATISGFKMIGDSTSIIPILMLDRCANSQVTRVDATGTPMACFEFKNCFESSVDSCRAVDHCADAGLNYGIHISNSQRLSFHDCFMETTRHGFSGGGNDSTIAVPTREITITGGTIAGGLGSGVCGLNWHGNCELVTVNGVMLPNGAYFAANHSLYTGCTIRNANVGGYGIADQGEPTGTDHSVIGCTFIAQQNFAGGLVGFYSRQYTSRGGTFSIKNCNADLGTFTGVDGAFDVYTIAGDGCTNMSVVISGNSITGGDYSTNTYGISVRSTHGFPIAQADLSGNTLIGAGIRFQNDIKQVTINGNTILNAAECGIYNGLTSLSNYWTNCTWKISGNHIRGAASTGIRLLPRDYASVQITDNHVINCATTPATNSFDSSIWVSGGNDVIVENNTVGDFDGNQEIIFALDSITNLFRLNNVILGNALPNQITSITSDHIATSGQFTYADSTGNRNGTTGMLWDPSGRGLAIAPGIYGDYLVPFYVRRQTNGLVQIIAQNDVDLGNTSAGMAYTVLSKDSGGYFIAYPSDSSQTAWQKRIGILANSQAVGITISAESSGQDVTVKGPGGGYMSWIDGPYILFNNATLRNAANSFSADQNGLVTANGFAVGSLSGIFATNSWSDGGGTNWTMKIAGGIVTELSHTP